MIEPPWLRRARHDIGLREIPGAESAPRIRQWLADLGAWWRDDETPWCGVAVAAWMRACGIERPRHWYRARGWLDWGQEIQGPAVGVVVIFERPGGGHVGLITGKDKLGRLMVLGGNQGGAVSDVPFKMGRVLGYRWPANVDPYTASHPLPLIAAAGMPSSSNEA